jgi:ribosomal protein S27E
MIKCEGCGQYRSHGKDLVWDEKKKRLKCPVCHGVLFSFTEREDQNSIFCKNIDGNEE